MRRLQSSELRRKPNLLSKRKALSSTAALLGLSGGALGWAGLAEAAKGERSLQTLLLPDHYQILDDGTVVFALKTGEQMSLSEEQYVLLDGGLVLVVDELAQNAMAELPVMGSLRTQLMTEVEPVRSPDGSIVEVSSTQPLWSGEGPTPRLFEQVDVQSYELAQNVATEEGDGLTIWGVARSLAVAGFGLGFGPSGLKFTSGDSVKFAEGGTGTVYQAAATDYDGREPEYSMGEGGDSSLFSISADGALTFKSSPDYENPLDTGGDNFYEVQIKGTYRNGKEISKTVTVEVTDVTIGDASPVFGTISPLSMKEGRTATGYTPSATDADGDPITYSISGGPDASLFQLNSLSDELEFVSAPSYGVPLDDGGDNTYNVTIQAADSTGNIATQDVAISVSALPRGFTINGERDNRQLGPVTSAGDINNDGYDDILIGSGMWQGNGDAWVIFGKAGGYTSTVTTDSTYFDGTNGFKFQGTTDNLVSSAGDINNDGFDDIMVGMSGLYTSRGYSWVIYGRDTTLDPYPATLSHNALINGIGFEISGQDSGDNANKVSSAGDINNDGFDDFIIGAGGDDDGGDYSGSVFVVYGRNTDEDPYPDEQSTNYYADGVKGFRLNGLNADDSLGSGVSSLGDFNGDGIDDFAVGATGADLEGSNRGQVYVVFGKDSALTSGTTPLDLNSQIVNGDGTDGFAINGASDRDAIGSFFGLSGAGDFNGDGFDDIIVAARKAAGHDYATGQAYVIFGRETAVSSPLEVLRDIVNGDGTDGFAIDGLARSDEIASVSSAGDINNDGFDDIIIGSMYATGNGSKSGQVYVIFGRNTDENPMSSSSEILSNIVNGDGTEGFYMSGLVASDYLGASVSTAGDINNDEYDDIIIHSSFSDPNNINMAGQAHVVFGQAEFDAFVDLSDLAMLV